MSYLESLLRGSALSMISGVKLSNDNYNAALNLLKAFRQQATPNCNHIKILLEISTVSYLKNISQLKSVYDNIETLICGLNSLNVTPKTCGPLLLPVPQSKLPSELNLIILMT